ncbi:DNA-binding PadR family transcriptional regulator [Salinibacterium sp. CAN_S4]|uniref:PadR family transcriptional regulator n=1 Tax=Salinibacterium sp. CAN_S4 TaxID=2787727 RepID=UPI0018EFFCA6
MSIRQSLLAILDEGDCYGYQLRVEFERRTGHSRSLNVGQVYATLDRLERDGLVLKLGANSTGHVYYAITDGGRLAVRDWFGIAMPSAALDELALKVALAQSLPRVDAAAVVALQRESTAAEVDALRREESAGAVARQLVGEAQLAAAEAELGWLLRAEVLVRGSESFGLEAEPPRRGRPVRG